MPRCRDRCPLKDEGGLRPASRGARSKHIGPPVALWLLTWRSRRSYVLIQYKRDNSLPRYRQSHSCSGRTPMAIDSSRSRPPGTSAHAWLQRGGEMGALIRSLDWSATPIGAMDSWSPALRMMVQFLLANRFPMLLWWGPQYISIYNDPYRPILGNKHPWALGQPVSACWNEIWHILQPLIDTPFNGGPATWNEDIALEINRHGFIEETHFTIAYSPVPDETV